MDEEPIKLVLGRLGDTVVPSGDSGRQWAAICPAHEDRQRSLGIGQKSDGRVLLKCYAGCDAKAVVRALGLEMRDLFPDKKERKVATSSSGVTVAMLAFDKRLPPEFLKGDLIGLRDDGGPGNRQVLIPYRDEGGAEMFCRVRLALKAKDGTRQPRGTKLRPYGLWRLADFRAAGGRLILVEGESDCWALWLHGYPAIGIPGAAAVGCLTPELLAGFGEVYAWREPNVSGKNDAGAEFVAALARRVDGLRVVHDREVKDPCDLQQRDPAGFAAAFDALLAAAVAPAPVPVPAMPAAGAGRQPLTDLGNARRLVARHGKDILYCHPQQQWYVWDGVRWRPDDTGEIVRRAKDTVAFIYQEAADQESPKEREAIARWAITSQSAKSIWSMIRLACDEVPVSPEQLDANPWLMNCPNGTLNLNDGVLLSHRRGDFLTKLCPTEFHPDAESPTWEKFLTRVFAIDPKDPDDIGDRPLIDFVQRLFGYMLTGVIRQHILPIFWGTGANGKTTLLNAVREVMGDAYAAKAPRGLLMARKHEQHPAEMMIIKGRRLIVASETAQDSRLNEEFIKDLTGGEALQARGMRENFQQFEATAKIIKCTNYKPRVVEGGKGIWRRLRLIPFLTSFWDPTADDPGPEHLKQDETLPTRLKEEYQGILTWLVVGCVGWQQHGLKLPRAVREQTDAYREDEDWVAAFLTECCSVSNTAANTSLKDIYAKYCEWVESSGGRPVTNRRLKAGLVSHAIVVKPGSGNVVYCYGVALSNTSGSTPAKPTRTISDFDE